MIATTIFLEMFTVEPNSLYIHAIATPTSSSIPNPILCVVNAEMAWKVQSRMKHLMLYSIRKDIEFSFSRYVKCQYSQTLKPLQFMLCTV